MKKYLMIISLIAGISLINEMLLAQSSDDCTGQYNQCVLNRRNQFAQHQLDRDQTDCELQKTTCLNQNSCNNAQTNELCTFATPQGGQGAGFCQQNDGGTLSCRFAEVNERLCIGKKQGHTCYHGTQGPIRKSTCVPQANGILTCQ